MATNLAQEKTKAGICFDNVGMPTITRRSIDQGTQSGTQTDLEYH
jgi:hypothetical protein